MTMQMVTSMVFALVAVIWTWGVIKIIRSGRNSSQSSSRSKEPAGLPTPTDTIEMLQHSEKNRKYECGHEGPAWFTISLYGDETKVIKTKKNCHLCLIEEMRRVTIRCASCRLAILPGEAVASYHESSNDLHKDIAKRVGDNYLGCLRWDCCPSGAFFSGHWNGREFAPAFGGNTAAAECFETGKGIIGDVETER